jgi:hypothetical protein
MYVYTAVVAGGCGLGMLVAPDAIRSVFKMPSQDPVAFGIVGSVYLAFGIPSILGLRFPLKFVPVLLLQLCYKLAWFVGLVLPLLIKGQFPSYGIPLAALFATFVIGDFIAIPFPRVLSRESHA